jgi:hypothetical protein
MTRTLTIALAWLCLGASPYEVDQYRVRIATSLHADEWVSGYGYVVRQTDLRYRMQVDALPHWGRSHGVAFFFDSDLGTDLGPSTQENRATLGDSLTRIDLFRAELMLTHTIPHVTLRLGRHTVYDSLGFDALDGASFRLTALPAVDIVGHAGMGLQTRWLSLGPVTPHPVNNVARESVGYVTGAGIETKLSGRIHGSLSWRRHFATEIQEEKVGARIGVSPTPWLTIDASGSAELIFGHLLDGGMGVQIRPAPGVSTTARATYHYPHFSADTIWVAFARSPFHGAELGLNYRTARWRYWLRGEGRLYAHGEEIPEDGLWQAPDFEGASSWLGHGAVEHRIAGGAATIGASGSVNWGYGGRAAVSSVNLVTPLPWPQTHRPMELTARVGGSWYEDAERTIWNGLSNWTVLGGRWRPDEGIAIGGQVEGFISDRDRSRARLMLTVRMENGW